MVLLSSPRYVLLVSQSADQQFLRVYDVAKESCVREASLGAVSRVITVISVCCCQTCMALARLCDVAREICVREDTLTHMTASTVITSDIFIITSFVSDK